MTPSNVLFNLFLTTELISAASYETPVGTTGFTFIISVYFSRLFSFASVTFVKLGVCSMANINMLD